ncbi:MAG: hypothetical protein CBC57_05875 [Euryarchaeota archaeon TMED97]|nr:MAG: hypothetical protein CBC57_05875 [Euryarchaeota archaeon TMED97]
MSRASDLRNITATGTASEDNYVLTYDDATKKLSLEAAAGGDLVDDTTPQLGGNLDVNGQEIVTTSNGDLNIAPNGWGVVQIKGNSTGGSGKLSLTAGSTQQHSIKIQAPATPASGYTLTLPDTTGNSNQVLKTDGSGNLDWTTITAGIANVVDDTTPQLGGDLSTNGHSIIINQSGLITGEVLRFNNSSGTFGTVLYRNSALSDFYMNNYVGHLRINNEDTNKNIIITTDGLVDINANNGDVDITAVGGTVKLAGDTGDMTFTNTYNGKFVMTGSTSDAYLKVYTASASQGARGLTIGSSSENDWFIERSASNNDLKFYYNPSTRMKITSNGVIEGASNAEITTSPIRKHSNTISTDTTIASTENAVSGGPISIASGITVTVDGDWTVV